MEAFSTGTPLPSMFQQTACKPIASPITRMTKLLYKCLEDDSRDVFITKLQR